MVIDKIMDADKIIIIIALIIVSIIFVFRGKILDEIQLLRQTEATELTENLVFVYFEPLSQRERIDAIKNYIKEMTLIQELVSKSIFVKYFVDYRDHILEHVNEVFQKESELDKYGNIISFSTPKLNNIIASTQFSKDQLLQLADLIDDTFPGENETGLYTLEKEHGQLVIDISPFEDFDQSEKGRLQEFVDRISKYIFQDEPISLRVANPESENEEYFESR